jgi:hypothetical protein
MMNINAWRRSRAMKHLLEHYYTLPQIKHCLFSKAITNFPSLSILHVTWLLCVVIIILKHFHHQGSSPPWWLCQWRPQQLHP